MNYDRVKQIFSSAIKLAPEDRGTYLDEQCAEDRELRVQVEALLDHHSTVKDPPEKPTEQPIPGEYQRGDTVGPFTILQPLGSGGMGAVYQAQQTQPIQRVVAIKVIKPGVDTSNTLARFQAESQAMAIMDHPCIAKVHEAGATDTGRPWFAMEYIQGEELLTYCDENKLNTRDRLKLFILICEAIQHAHQKGIMHRDLKPGNILVTRDKDDQPLPKIIDFGIAKAINVPLTQMTLHTNLGMAVGTLPYMSPEQVRGSSDIDMRTDVYSLGIILYQLISGYLPFSNDSSDDTAADLDTLKESIRSSDPPRPSVQLSSANHDQAELIAKARGTDTSTLASLLRKELEWIPLKALSKERHKRYASPEALAADVQRYLDGEALEAVPETRTYRTRKFISRNKGPVITAASFALVLVAATAVSTVQWSLANSARAQAEHDRLKAEDSEAAATTAKNEAEQAKRTAEEATKQVKEQLAKLVQKDKQLALRDERIAMQTDREKMSVEELNRLADTLETYRDYILVATKPGNGKYIQLLWKKAGEIEFGSTTDELVLLRTLYILSLNAHEHYRISFQTWNNRLNAIEQRLTDQRIAGTRELLDRITGYRIEDFIVDAKEAMEKSDWKAAAKYLDHAEAKYKDRDLGTIHEARGDILHYRGNLHALQDQWPRAESMYKDAVAIRRLHVNRQLGLYEYVASQNNLATALMKQGKYDLAEPLFRKTLRSKIESLGREHIDTLATVNNLGELHVALGEEDESNEHYKEAKMYHTWAVEGKAVQLGPDHLSTLKSMSNLGDVISRLGENSQQSQEILTEVIEKRKKREDPKVIYTQAHLANHWRRANKFELAHEEFKSVIDGCLQDDKTYRLLLIETHENLIELHDSWHEAEPDAGHDVTAAEYRQMLAEIQGANTNTTAESATP